MAERITGYDPGRHRARLLRYRRALQRAIRAIEAVQRHVAPPQIVEKPTGGDTEEEG